MCQPEETALQYAFIRLPVMVMALDVQGNLIAWNRECEKVKFMLYLLRADIGGTLSPGIEM